MLPVLLTVGPVKVYAYGLFLFLSLFFGLFWWWRLGRDENLDEVKLFDAFFLSLVWFVIGGRLAYWWWGGGQGWQWWQIFDLWDYPGLIDWFGLSLAGLSLISYSRRQNWQIMKILDMAVVVLSFILMGVNIGGFLNGSNPGKEVAIFGVRYPGSQSLVFPVDLWGVVWFGLGLWLVAKVRREFRFYSWYKGKRGVAKDGLSFLVFVGWVGGYYLGDYFLDDHGNWWVGVGLILVSLGWIYHLGGKKLEFKLELKDRSQTWWGKLRKVLGKRSFKIKRR